MSSQSLRGAFASSTKYLRQSRWPYPAAFHTQSTLYHISIFLSSTKYFKMSCDHSLLPVCAASFSVSREGFTLSKRNRRQSRCPPSAASLHDLSSSHGQSLEKQYFNISRLPIAAATVIVLSSHSHCFTSLAHLRNSSLFVAATSCKTRLDLSPFHFYFLSPACYSTPIPTSKWMNIRNIHQ